MSEREVLGGFDYKGGFENGRMILKRAKMNSEENRKFIAIYVYACN